VTKGASVTKADESESEDVASTNVATGDINNDSYDDTIVGDPTAGKVYVYFGTSTSTGARDISTADVVISCVDATDDCGRVVLTGEVSQDSYKDIIIGASLADGEGDALPSAGEIYIVYGADSLPSTIDLATYAGVNTLYGKTENGGMGYEMLVIDVDGNGTNELVANLYNNTAVVFSFDLMDVIGRALMLSRLSLDNLTGTLTAPKVMLKFKLTASVDDALSVSDIKLTASGTGYDNTQVKSVRLYQDVNADGKLDDGDRQIGSTGTFSSDNGTLTFSSLAETVDAGTSEIWMVVYEFQNGTSGGVLNISDSVGGGWIGLAMFAVVMAVLACMRSMTRITLKKVRKVKFLRGLMGIVLMAILFEFTACGDSPDYGTSSTDATGTYTFKVSIASSSDITTSGSSGGTVEIIGAPVSGEEVSVTFSGSSSSTTTPATETPTSTTPSSVGLGGSGGIGCSLIR
jgi:hypothetical protein